MKFGRLLEGSPTPKVKIQNPEILSQRGPKWQMKNVMFFNFLAQMHKTRNTIYNEAS
jgi:hypothetical protein